MKKLNVLSLFDGISCGQEALKRAGIKINKYYASETNSHTTKITQKHYPETKQLGNVLKIKGSNLNKIDLLIGGSPCQGFSYAGKGLNFKDKRSLLFFEFVRLLKETKPKNFLLENVKMKKEWQEVISKCLGVEPIELNSNLVSGQNRSRLYWTNIKNIKKPKDKNIFLNEILQNEEEIDERYYLTESKIKTMKRAFGSKGKAINFNIKYLTKKNTYKNKEKKDFYNIKSPTLVAAMGGGGGNIPLVITKERARELTEIECERLQTLKDDYTKGISKTQRYKAIGNGWTVDIISHILKKLNE